MESSLAATYRRFAEIEAAGVSSIYFDWANSIADDPEVLDRIDRLPRIKRQPNLVFAAARWVGGPIGAFSELRPWLLDNWPAVEQVVVSRSTQTNEAARCAVLLSVLSEFTEPLALIEAGASAGLVLYPDRYSYRYDTGTELVSLDPPAGPSPVALPCRISTARIPTRLPEVVWRAGVDLNPIDANDAEQIAWLETLVWPEHDARRERLHAAARLVAADPPHLVQGDIIEKIPQLVAQAPVGARVIVFHSAVAVYLTPERREQFVELMSGMPEVTWISNEGRGVFPAVDARASHELDRTKTIIAVNGTPIALAGPHGQSYQQL